MKPENKEVVTLTMGEKLLKLRKARQWSQEELADKIGVTRQAVSRWESGSAKPDAEKIIALCDLFGVSADYLLREEYAAEIQSMEQQPVQARGKSSNGVTGVQILGALCLVLGVAVLLVLVLMSVENPHWYHTGSRTYKGLAGFLLGNRLVWLMVADGIALFLGVMLLAWSCIFSWIIRRRKT